MNASLETLFPEHDHATDSVVSDTPASFANACSASTVSKYRSAQ